MSSLAIGIDCGTQGVKAIALDVDEACVVAQARRPLERIAALPPGAYEQHPEDWWKAVEACLGELFRSLGPRCSEVRAVGVAGQQHGFVPLDDSGHAIRPAKLWCDTHTEREARELQELLGGLKATLAELGNGIAVGFTASKILWMKRAEPGNFARLAHVALPHDFVNYRLSGRLVMEAGDASGTGLFDVRARAFSRRALAAIDEDLPSRIPPLVSPREPIGTLRPELARAWGLREDVLVSPGGGDNMLGAIGTGNVRAGIVTCSLGTSGTLYAYSPSPVVDPRGEIAAFCDSTGAWLPLVCTLSCTLAIEGVRSLLRVDHAELEALAERAPAGCEGLVMLPTFEGERTPDLPFATGTWFGLRDRTMRPTHLARSAYEGATLALAHGLARLRDLGVEPSEIRLTGGGSHSPLWRRLTANVFGVPCVALEAVEGAALGAALQAAWVAGEEDLPNLCDHVVRVSPETREEPRSEEVSRYAELAELYQSLHGSLRERYEDHRHFVRNLPEDR